MAYADTLNALSAALGDGGGSSAGSVPPVAPAASPQPQPAVPQGGYADTLSALSSALGGGAAVPTPAPTPQQQALAPSATDDPPIDPSLHPMTIRRGGALATAIPGSATVPPAAMTPPQQPDASSVPAQPAPQPAPVDTPRQPIPLSDVPGDVVQSGASGVESGALGLAALPRTMHDAAQFGAQWAMSKLTGTPLADIQARDAAVDKGSGADQSQAPSYDALKSGLESMAGPMYQPKSVAGDYAHTVGEFLPGAGEAKAGAAAAGLASEAAGQATQGTALEPYARAGTALLAGPAADLAGAAASKTFMPLAAGTPGLKTLPAVQNYVDQQAGQALLKSSSDPAALRGFAAAPTAPDLVPNSPNTLAAAVGNDPKLFQAEKAARNVDNTAFNAVDAAKSNAQVAAVQGIQPTGDVFAPGQMIRSRLNAIDQTAQDTEDNLNAAHQSSLAQSAATQQATVGAVADRQAATTGALTQGAQDATAALGPRVDPDVAGAALRQSVEDAKNTARQARSSLYQAVDPDGTLALVSSPVRDAATNIVGGMDPLAAPMTADANRIFAKARTLPDVLPFNSLTAFEQDITGAMSAERRASGETPSLMRLGQLKGAVQDAISNAADNQAAHESRMVSGGLMQPADTFEARFAREASQFAEDRRASARGGVSASTGTGGVAGSTAVYPANGGQVQSGRRLGDATGDPGVQGANGALQPNFDDAAADRLNAAKAAHADYAQTYRQGPVGDALKTTGFAGQYRIPDAGVLAKAFHPGDTGGAHLDGFLRASNNDPRAINAVADYALNGLRARVGPSGILRQADIDRWMTANAPAIQRLDQAKPGFTASVQSAGAAEQTLVQAGLAHRAEMQAANAEAARQALATNNASLAATRSGIAQARGMVADARATPAGRFDRVAGDAISGDEVQNAVGAMLRTGTTGATRMRGLVQGVQSNPAALDGLRKAGVDWMAREFVNDGNGLVSPAKMIGFLKDNADVLKELYPHDQVSMFGALARDAEAGIKWRTETAVKGGSDSVKNALAQLGGKAGEAAKHISLGMVAVEAISQGFEHGGIRGAALGGAGAATAYMLNSLRSAGIHRVSDLYREALANPAVARDLISKMPAAPDGAKLHSLARNLKRAVIVGPMAVRGGQ